MVLQLFWILIAAILGYSIAALFAGCLKLPRDYYLLIYIPFVTVLFALFIISNDIDLKELIIHNWYWGLLGAAIATILVIRNVLSQPSSDRSTGLALMKDLLWPGFAYGVADVCVLTILPVMAVKNGLNDVAWGDGLTGQLGSGTIAFLASCLVTVVYHMGYPEFRNKTVFWAVLGNGILTITYILTDNPLAAIIPHVGMHMTAMIHGRETTGQVPPHY
jgi:hypothetical protein